MHTYSKKVSHNSKKCTPILIENQNFPAFFPFLVPHPPSLSLTWIPVVTSYQITLSCLFPLHQSILHHQNL